MPRGMVGVAGEGAGMPRGCGAWWRVQGGAEQCHVEQIWFTKVSSPKVPPMALRGTLELDT